MSASQPAAEKGQAAPSGSLTISKLATMLAGFVVLSALLAIGAFTYTRTQHKTYVDMRKETREVRVVQQALSDAQIAVRGLVEQTLSGTKSYETGNRILLAHAERIALIDAYLKDIGKEPIATGVETLQQNWRSLIDLVALNQHAEARAAWRDNRLDEIYSATRDGLERYWFDKTKIARNVIENDDLIELSALLFQILAGGVSLAGIGIIFKLTSKESRERREARTANDESHARMRQLFQMTDMLQSAAGIEDANAVLMATAGDLLTDFGGALYIFNDTHDLLVRSTVFGCAKEDDFSPGFAPGECWALKRGKAHTNQNKVGSLRCEHHHTQHAVIEVPMTARGELIGVLHVIAKDKEAAQRLRQNDSIIYAIADGMSLALSNIILRDKLRSEILRNPLTRLYNPRYLEDTMQRLVMLAQRESKKLAAIAVQIDNFHRFGAERSQVLSNALLREVSAIIIGSLRRSDFAAHHDNQRILVLLPECSSENAVIKAELLRGKITRLSKDFSAEISASFGVASLPEHASDVTGLLSGATGALTDAIKAGGNCTRCAPPKSAQPNPNTDGADLIAAE